MQASVCALRVSATAAPARAAAAVAPRAAKPMSFSASLGGMPALRVAAAPRAQRRACATKAAAASGPNLTLPIDLRGACRAWTLPALHFPLRLAVAPPRSEGVAAPGGCRARRVSSAWLRQHRAVLRRVPGRLWGARLGATHALRDPRRPASLTPRCDPRLRRRQARLHRRRRRRPGAPAERRAAQGSACAWAQSASPHARAFWPRAPPDAPRRRQGFGWAIAKQLSQAGCEIILGTWVRALRRTPASGLRSPGRCRCRRWASSRSPWRWASSTRAARCRTAP